ncbi:transposable element Tcb1 transposase [Trichonephila clavipes]|nr:transposable element Tcb1 transposase [Trichonephila clavipes]
MDVCKCIGPLRHGGTLNSHRAASLHVRLVEREERWEAPGHPQGFLPLNWGATKLNRTVTCMVLKAKANDRPKNLALSRNEFHGPRSDFVRQVALVTTTTNSYTLYITNYHTHLEEEYANYRKPAAGAIVRHDDECVREGYIRNGGKEVKLFTGALKAFQCYNRIVMAQRKYLDYFLRGRIIGRLERGRTQLDAFEKLGIAQSVISRLWQRFQDDGNVSRCYSTGRPRVTTPNEDRYLAVTAKRNRRSTASDMSRLLSSATGTTVSRQTMYRRLGHIGLYARRPVRCVPLTATHCRLRLAWSREHALWTPQQWSCVMFSNESRFSLQSDSRRTLIWRAPFTRYHQENTIERHRYGGAGWLAFGEELFLVPELTCMFRV